MQKRDLESKTLGSPLHIHSENSLFTSCTIKIRSLCCVLVVDVHTLEQTDQETNSSLCFVTLSGIVVKILLCCLLYNLVVLHHGHGG